jgi:hypothetical protein
MAGGDGGPDTTGDAGAGPGHRSFRLWDGPRLAAAACQFHTQGERGQEGCSEHRFQFGQCQGGGGRTAGVDERLCVAIIEPYILDATQLISAASGALALRPRPTGWSGADQ